MSSQLPTQPRPWCLCGAQLPAPGPAEACWPPRPGASLTSQGQEPVLPGMPGSSQRTSFPRGSRSPRILSILLSVRGEKDGGSLLPHLCLICKLSPPPFPLPMAFAIHREKGRRLGK